MKLKTKRRNRSLASTQFSGFPETITGQRISNTSVPWPRLSILLYNTMVIKTVANNLLTKSGRTQSVVCTFREKAETLLSRQTFSVSVLFEPITSTHSFLPEFAIGRVKIQMMSKNLQQYYTLKCLIRDLLSNVFVSSKFCLAKVFDDKVCDDSGLGAGATRTFFGKLYIFQSVL